MTYGKLLHRGHLCLNTVNNMDDNIAVSQTNSEHHSLVLKEEVFLYLKESFLNEKRVSKLGEEFCRDYFHRLLLVLTIPPSYTVIRINLLDKTGKDQNFLLKSLTDELSSSQKERATQLCLPFLHPLMPDTAIIENVGPVEGIERLEAEIIVDHACGMSVLRGSEIFVQGILGAPIYLKRGDSVSVYSDLDHSCLRGQTRPIHGKKLFLGNGEAMISRDEIFCKKKTTNDDKNRNRISTSLISGVGVKMTNGLYCAPRLDTLNPELFFAQNLPSIVCSYVLDPKPDETILDMCAAPGGKTTHIATLMKDSGRLVALDRTLCKIQRISSLSSNLGLTCVETYAFDSTKAFKKDAYPTTGGGPPYPAETFDRILLDAPCSALGQRPAYRNNMTLSNLKSYPSYQRKLLTQAEALLKPGGVLVYSTCTVTQEENENQVAWVLKTFPGLSLSPQTPHVGGVGMAGTLLTEQQQKLVQRFDPVVSTYNDDDDEKLKTFDIDTIGFFIAKFVKSKKQFHAH